MAYKDITQDSHFVNTPTTLAVKLVSGLSAEALKTRQDKELALWYALRAINHWGSGRLKLESALAILIDSFGYSQQTAYRHLKIGRGKFWDISLINGSPTIEIKAIKTICLYLDTSLPGDVHSRSILASQFTSLKQRRSQLYASIHKPAGIKANPISREGIETYTGLSKIQQLRYEKEVGTKRTPNFGVIIDEKGETHPIKDFVFSGNKAYQVNKRLANIYHTNQEAGSKGMLRKVRAELRRSLRSDEALPIKRYFKGIKSLLRGSREGERYYLVRNNRRLIKGRLEWCQVFS